MTRTKSKLGTDKEIKSVSRRKPKKEDFSTTSTTLQTEDTIKYDQDWQKKLDKMFNSNPKPSMLWQYILWAMILYLIIWIFIKIVNLILK